MKINNDIKLTFDDVLIQPKYSTINSRKYVNLSSDINGLELDLPIISANMDTITERVMCNAMHRQGAVGCFHRFTPIERQLEAIKLGMPHNTLFSFGLSETERDRVYKLYDNNVRYYCLDVANGAQKQVAEQTAWFIKQFPQAWLMVGNFASKLSVAEFLAACGPYRPNAIKVGIGPGSACTTRIKTGIGYPQLSAIMEISDFLRQTSRGVIADGGCRTSGDIAKALAAGADAVMLGGMLAGTEETPGIPNTDIISGSVMEPETMIERPVSKTYRGSASKESYEDQDKEWDCAEGEAFTVPYKGPVENILKDIKGGLKSCFSYVGAKNIIEFKEKAEFIRITSAGMRESIAHGKN